MSKNRASLRITSLEEHAPQTTQSNLTLKLKALYKAGNTIPKLIEDPSVPTQKMDDYYVNLQILLNNKGERQEIEAKNIFDEVKEGDKQIQGPASKILIIGGAGIGKTTFLHNIAYRWSGASCEGEMFNDKFDYIFKVRLKLLIGNWNNIYGQDYLTNPLGCFIHYCLYQEAKVINQDLAPAKEEIFDALRSNKERTLLLLDGYDEVAHLTNRAGV
ncbi:MAG: NACHT domain-containing protein, partial [Rickettsiaceae bacterium]|nr:NACHT domain-containing protein [Rickettsiaceae bacterium]